MALSLTIKTPSLIRQPAKSVGSEDGRSLAGGEVKLLAEEVQGGVPVALGVGVDLGPVRLELLPLPRVLRHAV